MALVPAQVITAFRQQYPDASEPVVFRAPGRVNLIGEHTDYNLGFVFPIALEMSCYVATAPADHGKLRIYSREIGGSFSIPVSLIANASRQGQWHDYVVGVAQQLHRAGVPLAAAELWIGSEVPSGSGLSSSASLEVSVALALLKGREMDRITLTRLAQAAESQFVGIPSGIMDQYASVFGRAHAALQIDCRELSHEYVPLPNGVEVIGVNSLVKHEHGSGAYRERVAECHEAVAAIRETNPSVQSLRDVSLNEFLAVQDTIPVTPRKRARHVVTEDQRVLDFAAACRAGDLGEMGRLFVGSHRSMQYDYEITCEEINFLVDTAIKLPGVYGSRMTGGGFGGCTVSLVDPVAVPDFRNALTEAYGSRFGITPLFYHCIPADGAGPVDRAS